MCKTILIVDDSITARMMIRRCLEIVGYSEAKFIEASNGIEALTQLKTTKVDLIFTDLNMPEMDGEHFLKQVKSNRRFFTIPVIVISSKTNKSNEAQLHIKGAAAVIDKPITPTLLADIIDSLDSKKLDTTKEFDSSEIIKAMENAVAESFETFAFSEITSKLIEDTFPDLKDNSIGASIDIIQPLEACLSLIFSKTYAQEINDLLYGEDLNKGLLSDLIAEFANTVAGRFAAALSHNKEKIELGLPVSAEGVFLKSENKALENTVVITFDIDDQKVVCCLEKGKNSFDTNRAFGIQTEMKG